MKKKEVLISRGLKNNNPFNLNETETDWLGQVPSSDSRFAAFIDLGHGLRAGLINLYNGYFSTNLTLRQILARYAPGSDGNNEAAYLAYVSKRTGIIPEQIPGKSQRLAVASAILFFENGQEVRTALELQEVVLQYKLVNYA